MSKDALRLVNGARPDRARESNLDTRPTNSTTRSRSGRNTSALPAASKSSFSYFEDPVSRCNDYAQRLATTAALRESVAGPSSPLHLLHEQEASYLRPSRATTDADSILSRRKGVL